MATYKDSLMYNKEHTITFATTDGASLKNTWIHFHLIPTSRPVVNPPEVKTNYVDIPGADGSLDYTEALGSINYGNRTGSWEFMVANGYAEWYDVYNAIREYIHGKEMLVRLNDEKAVCYKGRLSVNQWKSDQKYSSITIDYNFNPYDISVYNSGGDLEPDLPNFDRPDADPNPDNDPNPDSNDGPSHVPSGGEGSTPTPEPGPGPSPTPDEETVVRGDWLWDETFGVSGKEIYHGLFTVYEEKYRNFYNPGAETQLTLSLVGTDVNLGNYRFTGSVYYKDTVNPLVPVNNTITVTIDPGDNEFRFVGDGGIKASYSIRKSS